MSQTTVPSPGIRSYFTGGPAFPVLFLVMFAGTAGMGMVSPLLPIFAEDMGASGLWLGLAFSGFAITQTPLMPVFGRLSDRHGRRLFLAAGLAVYMVVAIGMALAPNFYVLVLMRIASGVGAALLFPIASAYAGELSPPGEEGAFMGVFNIAFFAGWGIGPLIGGTLSDTVGMDAAFISQAVLAGIAMMIVLRKLPESTNRGRADGEPDESMRMMLSQGPIRALFAFQMAWAFNSGIALSFVAVYLTDELDAAAAVVGVIISTRVLLNGALQAPGGRLADRWNRTAMMSAGLFAASVLTFAIPSMGNIVLVWVLFVLLGLAESLATPAANATAVEIGRDVGMGSLMGLFNTAFSVGLVIGALTGGLVADTWDTATAFRMSGVVIAIASIGVALMMRRAGRFPARMPELRFPEPGAAAAPSGEAGG